MIDKRVSLYMMMLIAAPASAQGVDGGVVIIDDVPFHGFPDRPTPGWVTDLINTLNAESLRFGYGAWRGSHAIPDKVLAEFNALTLAQKLEFFTYRVQLEKPSAKRWAAAIGNASHPEIENALSLMLESELGHTFRATLLEVVVLLGAAEQLRCIGRLKVALTRVARNDDKIFLEDELPTLLCQMRCDSEPRCNAERINK